MALGACGGDTVPVVFEATEVNPTFVCLIPNDQIFDGGWGATVFPHWSFQTRSRLMRPQTSWTIRCG